MNSGVTDDSIHSQIPACNRRWCIHASAPAASVSIEFRADIDRIVRDAPRQRAVIVRVDPETVVLTFTAFGESARAVHHDAYDFLESIGFPDCAQIEHQEAEAASDQTVIPDLIGVKEVARLLGVTKQRASDIQRRPGPYPRPVSRVDATPLWLLDEVVAFVAAKNADQAISSLR